MHSMESMPQRLARLRRAQGLSQEKLAEALGVSRQAVSKWESAQANPDIRYLAALSRQLGVSADYLLSGSEVTGSLPEPASPPPPLPRFYGLLILGIALLTLGFAGALSLALASTGQLWSMQIHGRIYTGLAGYLLCNPPLHQVFILCVAMCAAGLLLSAADIAAYWLLRRRARRLRP